MAIKIKAENDKSMIFKIKRENNKPMEIKIKAEITGRWFSKLKQK